MKLKFILCIVLTVLFSEGIVRAQIPVEILCGDKKASFDLMFFKYLKQKNGMSFNVFFKTL
jgi:hypothetical protein